MQDLPVKSANHQPILDAISALGSAPLTEATINQYIRPLFSKSLDNASAIYLANHSLGRMLDQTEHDVMEGLRLWSSGRDDVWEQWFAEMHSFRSQTATLLSAERPDCIIPKTSAGQALRTILHCFDQPITVTTSVDEFNSIDFILKVFASRKHIQLKFIKPGLEYHYQLNDLLSALSHRPKIMVLSMVLFTTGQLLNNLKTLVDTAHQQGTLVMLDLYHAAGVVPVNVQELDIDFAMGGSYKYLRGGPGSGWLYIHPRHLDGSMRTLETGWFAQDQAFAFARPETPEFAQGGNAFLESTPNILSFYQSRAGLAFILAVGVDRIREYSLKQQQFMEHNLIQRKIPFLGQASDRGAFISMPHQQAELLSKRLKENGVISDSRENLLRFCPDLLNTEHQLVTAIEQLSRLWNAV